MNLGYPKFLKEIKKKKKVVISGISACARQVAYNLVHHVTYHILISCLTVYVIKVASSGMRPTQVNRGSTSMTTGHINM